MNELRNKIGEKLPDQPLYHYTSMDGLMGILENKEIYASSILHLNDTKEYFEGVSIIDEVFKKKKAGARQDQNFFDDVEKTKDIFNEKDVFVSSFSEHDDQLSQWRGYTPANSGYSVGFDFIRDKFTEKNTKWLDKDGSFILSQCIYDEAKKYKKADQLVDQFAAQWRDDRNEPEIGLQTGSQKWHVAPRSVIFYLFFRTVLASVCKNSSFSEEVEWRLIYIKPDKSMIKFRKGLSSLIPYMKIPLDPSPPESSDKYAEICRVVIGPTPNKDLAESALKRFIETSDKSIISVSQSAIPYRSW